MAGSDAVYPGTSADGSADNWTLHKIPGEKRQSVPTRSVFISFYTDLKYRYISLELAVLQVSSLEYSFPDSISGPIIGLFSVVPDIIGRRNPAGMEQQIPILGFGLYRCFDDCMVYRQPF